MSSAVLSPADHAVAKPPVDRAKCLVELRNIRKAFGGVHAVDDVSMTLYPGEVVAVLATTARANPR